MSRPLHRRAVLALGSAALVAGAWPLQALAQSGGNALRILVGFPPGGGTDAIARVLAEKLEGLLGQPVVVDNRAGAGGQIAAQALKAAAPDGRTVFLTHDHSISILPLVTKKPGFDPATDFVAVAGFATFVNALALSGGTPAQSLPEYVQWVRTQGGGKGNVGVPAPASMPEFLVGVVGQKFGLDLRAVPYRGSAPMMADMLGNQVSAGVGSIPDFIENHKAGKIRVVAVMGRSRQAAVPDAPTFAELGLKGFEEVPYYGLFAPAGTPQAAIDRFGAALAKVVALPEVRERLTTMGLAVGYMTQQQLAARERAYTQAMAKIIKASGFTPQ
ncbi:Bug family tripartite tricarboxylate transporter substrate binding protein [Ramlibacter sp.]|uniref:Bug family tripartite tricarboxylate transporter substrate binding protein n=1 Tax=Ramlibacter sp. TaxID=1917967 RepID=UPI002D225F78|nr:Bug family tripartite tricarboxylate transporter substrate binding protein [Ramlibacter sp.]HYD78132.1 Bug family tripartite tricarboxylate transporter substrate binding protein [Ramlibacter sp.]